jgi:hypothetical protein
MSGPDKNEFDRIAQEKRPGLISEFASFLAHSKKWWLLPILIAILLVSLLVVLGGTGAAPFIYTLF